MASWPTAAQVKRRLGITRNDAESNADVQLALDTAIETVQQDAAAWLESEAETPDARLASAALLLAVVSYKSPDAPHGVAGIFDTAAIAVRHEHPAYQELLRGHRVDFGIGG